LPELFLFIGALEKVVEQSQLSCNAQRRFYICSVVYAMAQLRNRYSSERSQNDFPPWF
jgi:hypothetical protein